MQFQVLIFFQEDIHCVDKLTTLALVNTKDYISYLTANYKFNLFFIIGFIFPCLELYSSFGKFH